ncbi:MAG: HAD hydrolase family protein, partial [Negativicutes bacterium]|nr:HAD hydrolase family protein [Negativicutes bacterium]
WSRGLGDVYKRQLSKPTYLEMANPAVNKGRALALLADKLGIAREQVMAVGDSVNDLDMLRYAGWGVAMGNASDTVKAAAAAVTGANDAEGVAEAILRYALREYC